MKALILRFCAYAALTRVKFTSDAFDLKQQSLMKNTNVNRWRYQKVFGEDLANKSSRRMERREGFQESHSRFWAGCDYSCRNACYIIILDDFSAEEHRGPPCPRRQTRERRVSLFVMQTCKRDANGTGHVGWMFTTSALIWQNPASPGNVLYL